MIMDDSKTVKIFMDDIERLMVRFAKYCHAPSCERYFFCPINHRECYKRLDLDTAIAWRIYKTLRKVYRIFEMDYPDFNDQKINQLIGALDSLTNLSKAIYLNSYNYKYKSLTALVEELNTLIYRFTHILSTYKIPL